MSYSVYRFTAWNGKREFLGTFDTVREAAAICEADRQKYGYSAGMEKWGLGANKMVSYDIVGKEKSDADMN